MQMSRISLTLSFTLKGTLYMPQALIDTKNIPCVVYFHSHGGCRLEGQFLKPHVLPKMALCVFDFAGSGLSEGEYVSLGPKEKRDGKLVIDYIRAHHHIGSVYLWGRSMGAVAAILLAHDHPHEINALVLDSPFSNLNIMVDKAKLPG